MPVERVATRNPVISALTALSPPSRRERGADATAALPADPLVHLLPEDGEELGCYSQMYSSLAEVLRPRDVDELARMFAVARATGRRVTLRAGGNAFDAQALGDDLVISLERLDDIGVPDELTLSITVGAGARWGDILDAVAPLGLVPAVMVTTQNATAGGTLSGNCLSRFSPSFGKEGAWVRSFELLKVDGERLTCTPPRDGERPETWTREERAFMTAIGGLGYVGAVHRITYRLVRACAAEEASTLGVQTTLRKFSDYEHLAEHLVRQAQAMCGADPCADAPTLAAHDAGQAIYSALIRRTSGRQSAAVLTSTYTTAPERRPLVIHQPASRLRFVSELILRTRLDWILTLVVFHLLLRQRRTYVDDLRGFTFFMDGNARAKAWGKRHGLRMPTVQQTFIVPWQPDADDGLDPDEIERRRCHTLARFLDESHALMRKHRVRPTLSDILFVRDTMHFGLSANAGKSGFAVSFAFETSSERRLARIQAALAALAYRLTDYDGRVYLVKNVYASQSTLAAMYGDNVVEVLKLKRDFDPERLLDNDFLRRAFGTLTDEVYAGVHD